MVTYTPTLYFVLRTSTFIQVRMNIQYCRGYHMHIRRHAHTHTHAHRHARTYTLKHRHTRRHAYTHAHNIKYAVASIIYCTFTTYTLTVSSIMYCHPYNKCTTVAPLLHYHYTNTYVQIQISYCMYNTIACPCTEINTVGIHLQAL